MSEDLCFQIAFLCQKSSLNGSLRSGVHINAGCMTLLSPPAHPAVWCNSQCWRWGLYRAGAQEPQCCFKARKTQMIQKKWCNTFKPWIYMQESILLYFRSPPQLVSHGTANLLLDVWDGGRAESCGTLCMAACREICLAGVESLLLPHRYNNDMLDFLRMYCGTHLPKDLKSQWQPFSLLKT